jgi:hypothetical protein
MALPIVHQLDFKDGCFDRQFSLARLPEFISDAVKQLFVQ